MANKTLTTYTQTANSTTDLTQKEYMEQLAAGNQVTPPGDIDTPYTFKEWKSRNTGIIPGKEYDQYNAYLTNWYRNRYTQVDSLEDVKNNYLSLLQEIKLAFRNDTEFAWLNEINLDDDLELEDAIPAFARKLKEIAIYIVNKRDAIKKSKLKYNMSGARNALEKLFYEYLLKAFTKRDYVLNVPEQSAYNTFPDLSAVKDGFQIIIEELYDDSSYFDKDPKIPVSAYFDLTMPSVTSYFDTLGFGTSALTWLYGTGMSQLCAENPLIWMPPESTIGILASAFEAFDGKKLNDYNRIDLAAKYIGEDQYILSGGKWVVLKDPFLYNFRQTNNWVYWPSGESYHETPEIIYDALPISASSLVRSGATSNTDYTKADKIFTRVKENGADAIDGAWLKYVPFDTRDVTMSARLPDKEHYYFRFPYPGYGISGSAGDWSGKELQNINSNFSLQTDAQQKAVLKKYWSVMNSISTVIPMSIHDTNLVDQGAKSSFYYASAAQLSVRRNNPDLPGPGLSDDKLHDNNPSSVYKSDFEHSFLYKMEETDIPIVIGGTHIYWPILTYDDSTTSFPFMVPSSQCTELTLGSLTTNISFIGARAGRDFYTSDIIYKLNGKNGKPIEAAYLRGGDLSGLAVSPGIYAGETYTIEPSGVFGSYQPALTIKCKAGTQETFIWQGFSDLVLNTSTIFHKDHQVDCPYLRSEHKSILNNTHSFSREQGVGNWKDCRCKAIMYSPIGHPGATFDEYRGNADCIFVDTQWPGRFDRETWRGRDLKPYETSADFAWWQRTGTYADGSVSATEPDIGWGSGTWKTGDGSEFTLEQGVQYGYIRSTLEQSKNKIKSNEITPPLVIKQPWSISTYWAAAELQSDGTWLPTKDGSEMVLRPGDYLYYDHLDLHWYCLHPNEAAICNDTINFLINQRLQGWDYVDGGNGGRPWWAKAVDDDSWETKLKGVPVYGGGIRSDIIDNYTLIVQPDISTITLSTDDTIDYYSNNDSDFDWVEPLTFQISANRDEWCKLDIDYEKLSPLEPNLFYLNYEMVSIPTDELSNMALRQRSDEEKTLLNYWAQNAFTWNQELTASTYGFPPTGGRWLPAVTGRLIDALVPYANLTNRHYPTIASIPYIGDLYSTLDKGGYFTPYLLGAGVYLGKNYSNVIDTLRIPNDNRGLSAVYQDPNIYTSDAGLTDKTQVVPVSTNSIDAGWMKAGTPAGSWAGTIIGSKENQNFTPYKTKYESLNVNPNGIRTQNIEYDPWAGNLDNTWITDPNYTANFRGEYPIEEWYRDLPTIGKKIYNWSTDIFGNNYGLFKENNINSKYDLSLAYGDIWVRDLSDKIASGIDALSGVYDSFITPVELYSQLTNNQIRGIDLWFDTIMFETSGYIATQKLLFDYDTSRIFGIADNSRIINLSGDDNGYYAGSWFFEEEKEVILCNTILQNSIVYPYLRTYDIDSGELKVIYDATADANINSVSAVGYTEIEKPIFNYNYLTKTYNVSFIGYGAVANRMILTTINITNVGDEYQTIDIVSVTPAGG